MNPNDLNKIIRKVEKANSIFADKSYLDPLIIPSEIVGREKEAEQIVQYFMGFKQGHVVPVISVYGRSGSGKSTLVKFICENMSEISFCFANLRKSKTVFGCANLMLGEMGRPNLKSSQGINMVIDQIGSAIEYELSTNKKKLFVLVLDESDVLFFDTRGKPSEFIYKLVTLAESLRAKGHLLCMVMISNNVLSDYELDDRVRSRIGSSEVFFEPYSSNDVVKMLRGRAKKAFAIPVGDDVLQHCADLSSQEHGDARRAIDLLRVSGEVAGQSGHELTKYTVERASAILQEDRVSKILASASYHFKLVCYSLAWLSHIKGGWCTTSEIYKQYCKEIGKGHRELGYRRVTEILTDIQNSGLALSQPMVKSNGGYGRGYKLVVEPKIIGDACYPGIWENAEKHREIELSLVTMQKEKEKLKTIALRSGVRQSPYAFLQRDIQDQLNGDT